MTRSRQLLLLACCWPRLGQTERPSLAQRPRANVQRLQAGMDDEPPGKERGAKKTWLEDGLDDAPDMKDQDLYGEDPGVPPEESKAKYERELKLMTPDKIKMILNHMWRLHEQEHQKHNQMLKDRQDWLDKVQHQNDEDNKVEGYVAAEEPSFRRSYDQHVHPWKYGPPKCGRCGPHFRHEADTVVYCQSGDCNASCQELFGTMAEQTVFMATGECAIVDVDKKKSRVNRPTCRNQCRQIWYEAKVPEPLERDKCTGKPEAEREYCDFPVPEAEREKYLEEAGRWSPSSAKGDG